MIGTIICRNCDTAIEVSERDVSTFESQGSFGCPSCKEDLSARMADLLGTNRPSPSEERTVEEETAAPDPDAFEGLPVGGTLDDAARAMRVSPPAAPTAPSASGAAAAMVSSSAGAVPEAGGEDPLTLALRIAHQAQEQAAAAALEQSSDTIDEPRSTNGNGAHPEEPSPERTAPGTPFSNGNGASPANGTAGAPGSQVGVIPDEPDNEDTVRARANATQSTVDSTPGSESTIPEPTIPSESDLIAPDTSDAGPVIGEETPALTEEQRASLLAEEPEPDTVVEDEQPPARGAKVPNAPSSEATPSAPRPPPFSAMPEEPREEPTMRKTSPPPALHAPARLAPRTGTGPAGIGALGFRISSNRPVVRPAFNGRPSSPGVSTPAGGTPVGAGSTAIERPVSERVSIERPLADRPSRTNIPAPRAAAAPPSSNVSVEAPPPIVTGRPLTPVDRDGDRPAVPVWLLGIGVGLIATVLVAVIAVFAFGGGNPEKPIATPTAPPEETPNAEESPVETAVLAAPSATPVVATSTRTPGTPIATATAMAVATPTRVVQTPTPTPARTAAPTPTALAIATAKPTPAPATARTGKEKLDEIVARSDVRRAPSAVYLAWKSSPNDAEFSFEAWKFLAKPKETLSIAEQESSKKYAREVGLAYLKLPGLKAFEVSLVRNWITGYDAEHK